MVPGDGKQQPPAATIAGGSGSVPSHPNGSQAFPSLPPPSTVGVPPPGMGMSGPGQGGGVGFMPPPNPSHGFDVPTGGWGAPPQSGMMPPVPPPQQQQQPLPRGPTAAGGSAGGGDISSLLGQSLSQEERVGVDNLYTTSSNFSSQTLVTAALSMSQQELDMLPPQQRAIFMQLVCLLLSNSALTLISLCYSVP
jgi:hypothetical protein